MKKITAVFILIAMQAVFCFSLGIGAETEKISVIVELDLPEGEKSAEYAKKCADAVSKSACGFELEYIYDTLICGFSGKISANAVSLISALDFVSEVYSTAEYEALEYTETEYSGMDYGMISAAMVGYYGEASDTLTGDGIKVAVLDNGFDINHAAFDIDVTDTLDLESLRDSRGDKRPHAFISVADPMQLYHSSKIPFAYDYANRDSDVSTTVSAHGNHVAGIIGAAATEYSDMHGIAPGCQLILMKIFDEKRNAASDAALIAALEDALKLDADIINLSLGIYAGSASGNTIDMGDILDKAESMGCIIVSAAGNDNATTESSVLGLPLATYTDYGTVSFPSTEEHIISVASVDNMVRFGQYFRHAENKELFVEYEDTAITVDEKSISFTEYFHGETLEYAVIPGIGEEADYKGINVKGKLALIERGDITFAEKANIAEKMGAVGAVIYNNSSELITMDLTGAKIPAILISREDGKLLTEERQRSLEFSKDFNVREQAENGGKVSSFSSYGATPSLTLKPDICGVGGSILSLAQSNSYTVMTGTSMASPQVTGLLTLMLEKAISEKAENMADTARDIKTSLMNTAKPILQENGVEYSPRVQGAGLADIGGALSQSVRLTSTKTGLPKAELYDELADSFSIDITLENITDEPQTLLLGATLTNDGCTELTLDGESRYYSTLTSEADKYSNISIGDSGNLNRYAADYTPLKITLKGGEVKNISLKVSFDGEYHKKLNDIFTNGYFVEGFIRCETGDGREISMPYMGFAGDWGKGRITDGDRYSSDGVMFGGTAFYVPLESGIYVVAGLNIFDEDGECNGDSIAFSPNGDGYADSISFIAPLIRNCRMSEMTVTDSKGTKIYSDSTKYVAKTAGTENLQVFRYDWLGGDGIYSGYTFPDGQYDINIEYYLDYINAGPQTAAYTVIIDTTLPRVKNVSVTEDKIKIEAEDENEIYCISIYENDSVGTYLQRVTDAESAEFDISDYEGDSIYYEVIDCAYNIFVGKIALDR